MRTRLPLAFLFLIMLTGCSGLSTLGNLLPNSGTQVAASIQAGKTNTKTIGQTNLKETTIKNATAETIVQDSSNSRVNSDRVDKVNIQEGPQWWLILLLIIGWLLPSPNEIGKWLRRLFQREKAGGNQRKSQRP